MCSWLWRCLASIGLSFGNEQTYSLIHWFINCSMVGMSRKSMSIMSSNFELHQPEIKQSAQTGHLHLGRGSEIQWGHGLNIWICFGDLKRESVNFLLWNIFHWGLFTLRCSGRFIASLGLGFVCGFTDCFSGTRFCSGWFAVFGRFVFFYVDLSIQPFSSTHGTQQTNNHNNQTT